MVSNDEKIIFSVENLYRLWSKSPYWLQRKKNGETLYVFGISVLFCLCTIKNWHHVRIMLLATSVLLEIFILERNFQERKPSPNIYVPGQRSLNYSSSAFWQKLIISEAEPDVPVRVRSAVVHVERKQTTVRSVVTATARIRLLPVYI